MSNASTPVDQVAAEDWSGGMGERWLAHLGAFEGMIAPIGEALMARAAFAPGERVIDVGCGAGATCIEIARRVGPSGSVLGLDISPVLIDAAASRARDARVPNVQWHCEDAATFRLDGPPFDRLHSRFGLMFFPEPLQAFANLRRVLRRGARLDFSVWAPAAQNAWVAQIMAIVGPHVQLPEPVAHAPGPFAFDDPRYLSEVLSGAGFEPARLEVWQGRQLVGGAGASPEQAADFALAALHFGEMLEQSKPEARESVRAELVDLFARHRTPEGIAMSAKAFLVTTSA
jgi:SAM-dependent methyltransferase